MCISNAQVSPTVYLKDLYESCHTFDEAYAEIKEVFEIPIPESIKAYKGAVDLTKIVPCLVNYERNKESLKRWVHEKHLDMAVIYRQIVTEDVSGITSFVITEDILNSEGLTKEELFREIKGKATDYKMTKLTDLIGIPANDLPLYVLTNKSGVHGAAGILYKDVLKCISLLIGGDFYLMPSSVHEMIILAKEYSPREDKLKELVVSANASVVSPEEFLSNSLYLYETSTGKVKQV